MDNALDGVYLMPDVEFSVAVAARKESSYVPHDRVVSG